MDEQQEVQEVDVTQERYVEEAMLALEDAGVYPSVPKIREWLRSSVYHNGGKQNKVHIAQQAIKARRLADAAIISRVPSPPAEPLPDEVTSALAAGTAALSDAMAVLTGAIRSALAAARSEISSEAEARIAIIQADAERRIDVAEIETRDSFADIERLEYDLSIVTKERNDVATNLAAKREELAAAVANGLQLQERLTEATERGNSFDTKLHQAQEALGAANELSSQLQASVDQLRKDLDVMTTARDAAANDQASAHEAMGSANERAARAKDDLEHVRNELDAANVRGNQLAAELERLKPKGTRVKKGTPPQ